MDLGWDRVQKAALALKRHAPLVVPKDSIGSPAGSGFYKSVGLDHRAHAHWRRRIPGSLRGLHVLVFADHYLVHWDRIDPSVSVVLHFVDDVSWTFFRFIGRMARRMAGRRGVGAPALIE